MVRRITGGLLSTVGALLGVRGGAVDGAGGEAHAGREPRSGAAIDGDDAAARIDAARARLRETIAPLDDA